MTKQHSNRRHIILLPSFLHLNTEAEEIDSCIVKQEVAGCPSLKGSLTEM